MVRLDHFIGFTRYWEVPGKALTAERGRFVTVPGQDFFEKVSASLGNLPFIAEDLGVLTDEVHRLRDHFELPGMRILQFAFGDDPGTLAYRPHRYPACSVAYSGTHDNDTLLGWVQSGVRRSDPEVARALRYAGTSPRDRDLSFRMILPLVASQANLVVFPWQDLAGLDGKSRMNVPGTAEGNWGVARRGCPVYAPDAGTHPACLRGP